jgi:amino acid transporter
MANEDYKKYSNFFTNVVTIWTFVISVVLTEIDQDRIFVNKIVFNLVVYFGLPLISLFAYAIKEKYQFSVKNRKAILLYGFTIFLFFLFIIFSVNIFNQQEIKLMSDTRVTEVTFERTTKNLGSIFHKKTHSYFLNIDQTKDYTYYFKPKEQQKIFLPKGEYKISFTKIDGTKIKNRPRKITDEKNSKIFLR